MQIELSELSPAIGRRVSGIERVADITEAARKQLVDAYNTYGLLLFRGLEPTNEDHLELTRIFGEPDIHPIESIRLEGCPEIIAIASRTDREFAPGDPAGDAVTGKIDWHSDLSYTVRPGRGALLRAVVVPPEMGQTGFIDTAAVYSELPEQVKARIEGLEVIHSFEATLKDVAKAYQGNSPIPNANNFPPVVHPLVYAHPVTGAKVLNISPSFACEILGLGEDEGVELLAWLKDFATQERFIYMHEWQVNDILLWDNLRTMHCAAGYKARHRRVMYRTTLKADFVLGRLAA